MEAEYAEMLIALIQVIVEFVKAQGLTDAEIEHAFADSLDKLAANDPNKLPDVEN